MCLPVKLLALLLCSQIFDYTYLSVSPTLKVLFSLTPDRFFYLILLLVFGYAFVTRRLPVRPVRTVEGPIMFLFAALCTFSWLTTGLDFGTTRYKWFASLFNLIYLPFGVYLLVKNTRYSRKATAGLLWAMTGIGTYLTLTGVFEHYGVEALVWPRYILDPGVGIQWERVRGPFVSSVSMGEWLIAAFLSTSLLIHVTTGASRLFLQLLIPLISVVIYFTDQRSVWVSFAVVLAIGMVAGHTLRRQSTLVVVLIVLAFFVGIGSKFSISQTTLFSRRQETVDYRLANYRTAFRMGMSNFITGVGYGNFANEWETYFGRAESRLAQDLTDGNHNTYLGLFAETGIFGLLLYLSLFACMIKNSLSAWRRRDHLDPFENQVAVAALSLVVVTMIEAFFSDQRFDPTLNTLLFLFFGIVSSMRRITITAESAVPRSRATGTDCAVAL